MKTEAEPTDTVDLLEKLHQVVDRMLERFGIESERYFPQNALAISQTKTRRSPFDITRPNQHETKAEFQHEYKAVKDGIDFCGKLFGSLVAYGDEDERKSALVGLGSILTGKIKDRAPMGDLNQSHTLVQKIMADVGGFSSTMVAVLTLRTALSDRLQELENQRDKFWNVPYRAPDYYARAIALRLAKLYAKETNQLPTYGTSAITGEPSTDYMRAVKETFGLLDISGNPRTYAEWAVGQMTESDTAPEGNSLLATIIRNGAPSPSEDEILGRLATKSSEKGDGR